MELQTAVQGYLLGVMGPTWVQWEKLRSLCRKRQIQAKIKDG